MPAAIKIQMKCRAKPALVPKRGRTAVTSPWLPAALCQHHSLLSGQQRGNQRGYTNSAGPILPPRPCPTAARPHPHCGPHWASCRAPPHALGLPRASVLVGRWHFHISSLLIQRACLMSYTLHFSGELQNSGHFPKGGRLPVSQCPGEGRVSRPALQHSAAFRVSASQSLPLFPVQRELCLFHSSSFSVSLSPTYSCVICAFFGLSSPRLSLQSQGPAGTLFTLCSWC